MMIGGSESHVDTLSFSKAVFLSDQLNAVAD